VPAYRVPARRDDRTVKDMSTTTITSNHGTLTPHGELNVLYSDALVMPTWSSFPFAWCGLAAVMSA
ncbi:MAG: hypothetical protein ACYDHH_31280, partial [Solirubrobacteraceae bacterium]